MLRRTALLVAAVIGSQLSATTATTANNCYVAVCLETEQLVGKTPNGCGGQCVPRGSSPEPETVGVQAEWKTGSWSNCLDDFGNEVPDCGGEGVARKTREVTCVSVGSQVVVSNSACSAKEKPVEVTRCNTLPCKRYIRLNMPWGACSATCSGGVRTRSRGCFFYNSTTASQMKLRSEELTRRFQKADEGMCQADPADEAANPLTEPCFQSVQCPTPRYRFSSWSPCSATCGGGQTTRELQCLDFEGAETDLSVCEDAGLRKDEGLTQMVCNQISCTGFQWTLSEWGQCSSSCGPGTRQRFRECKSAKQTYGNSSHCGSNPRNEESSEPLVEDCPNQPDCEHVVYQPGPWSRCSKDCGGGVQTRVLFCYRKDDVNFENPITNRECVGSINLPNIETMQDCNMDPCQTFMYRPGEWGRCSATCGRGVKRRELECVNAKEGRGESVDPSRCASLTRPSDLALQEDCDGHRDDEPPMPCTTYMYRMTGWTLCSATCGGGMMTRNLTCHDATGAEVAMDKCNPYLKPTAPLRRECATTPCMVYAYHCDDWSPCSVTCGSGVHTRRCTCRGTTDEDPVGIEVPISNCPSTRCTIRDQRDCGKFEGTYEGSTGHIKPLERETCNTGLICRTHSYSVSPWCTLEANPCAQQKVRYSRTAKCVDAYGNDASDRLCEGEKPKSDYVCDVDEVVLEMYRERCGEPPAPPAPPTPPPTPAPSPPPRPACLSIQDVIDDKSRNLESFGKLVDAANLIVELQDTDPITIFAPTDAAWNRSRISLFSRGVQTSNCVDLEDQCSEWARTEGCNADANREFMKLNCPFSCNVCEQPAQATTLEARVETLMAGPNIRFTKRLLLDHAVRGRVDSAMLAQAMEDPSIEITTMNKAQMVPNPRVVVTSDIEICNGLVHIVNTVLEKEGGSR